MSTQYNFTSETDLAKVLNTQISSLWQTGEFSHFKSFDGTRIEYSLFLNDSNNHCIVISPGRIEGYLKYKELVFNLVNNGYNVAVIDHRGQGLSERLLKNPHKGYVKNFDDYAIDLNEFINKIVNPRCNNDLFLLGHSMGGAIAIRYLQSYPNNIKAIALTSPMIGIDSGSLPLWLGKLIINSSLQINNVFSDQAWYFIGHKDYINKPFTDNHLTHSTVRYKIFRDIYIEHPEIQLGGVTFKWLSQAIKAEKHIFEDIAQYSTPTLLLQASEDTVVSNSRQDDFCRELASMGNKLCAENNPVVIHGAKHEILFEKDTMRNKALSHILQWFGQH